MCELGGGHSYFLLADFYYAILQRQIHLTPVLAAAAEIEATGRLIEYLVVCEEIIHLFRKSKWS